MKRNLAAINVVAEDGTGPHSETVFGRRGSVVGILRGLRLHLCLRRSIHERRAIAGLWLTKLRTFRTYRPRGLGDDLLDADDVLKALVTFRVGKLVLISRLELADTIQLYRPPFVVGALDAAV